jgi:hypothetical protein
MKKSNVPDAFGPVIKPEIKETTEDYRTLPLFATIDRSNSDEPKNSEEHKNEELAEQRPEVKRLEQESEKH